MTLKIKKAIIPIAGLGTRFLPITKIVPKEIFPLVDKPIIQLLVEEALSSGIEEIIFVISSDKKIILDYFQTNSKLEKILEARQKSEILEELKKIPKFEFKSVLQRKPKGDGDAILRARELIGDEPCLVLFGDDIIWNNENVPHAKHLIEIFENYHQPIITLSRIPEEKFPFYGMVDCEKIANRLYKIKDIVEKPAINKSPSDLAIVGKYILTPEVFEYLKIIPPIKSGEIILANAFSRMLRQGKLIYGYEANGEWLECGNKLGYIKSFIKLATEDKRFGDETMDYIKKLSSKR